MNRLEQIEAREKAATPGPWNSVVGKIYAGEDLDSEKARFATWHLGGHGSYEVTKQDFANATFTAHAREDIPALLAVVRELARLCERAALCPLCGEYTVKHRNHQMRCPLAALLEESD